MYLQRELTSTPPVSICIISLSFYFIYSLIFLYTKVIIPYHHDDKVGCAASKGAFFKHPAVAVCENHVKQKVETYIPKE